MVEPAGADFELAGDLEELESRHKVKRFCTACYELKNKKNYISSSGAKNAFNPP